MMRIMRVLAVVTLLGLYAPTLAAMARVWWTDQYGAHGLFVPAFSLLLLWIDRDRLRAEAGRGSAVGISIILLGLGVLASGRWMGSLFVQGLSVPVAMAGVVLWSFGARCLRAAAFPVGFLAAMAPLPRVLVATVTLDLQRFAAGFAAAVARLVGIPVYLEDVWIVLPTITLQVAEICNGLRFLLALLVLTAAFAQVSQRSVPRKIALVLAAVPIAILANATRVAALAVGAYYVGPQVASGFIHHSIGKAVWLLTLIPLLALGLLLRRGGAAHAKRSPTSAVVTYEHESGKVTP